MSIRIAAIVLALVWGVFPASSDEFDAIQVAPRPVAEDLLPPPAATLADVDVLADIAFSQPDGFRPLRLDVYSARTGPARRPMIMFVHGGGWTVGTKRTTGHYADWPAIMAAIARRGFVVASVEYRLSGEAPFPAAFHDVIHAGRFLRQHQARFGIDASRVAVWGASAGAHLAGLVAMACRSPDVLPTAGPDVPAGSDCPQAFVGWYGPYNVELMMNTMLRIPAASRTAELNREIGRALAFFQCTDAGCPPGLLQRASPLFHAGAGAPSTLLVQGTADTLVSMAEPEALAAKLRAAGVRVSVEPIADVGHGWITSQMPVLEEVSKRTLRLTLDFLEKELKPR